MNKLVKEKNKNILKTAICLITGLIVTYFIFLITMHFLFNVKHVLLPIPTNGHSLEYELRIRKYLFFKKGFDISYLGLVFFDDGPHNILWRYKQIESINIGEIEDESDRKTAEEVGLCYLDGVYGSWRMTITTSSVFNLEEGLVALHTCNTDSDKDFFDYE